MEARPSDSPVSTAWRSRPRSAMRSSPHPAFVWSPRSQLDVALTFLFPLAPLVPSEEADLSSSAAPVETTCRVTPGAGHPLVNGPSG